MTRMLREFATTCVLLAAPWPVHADKPLWEAGVGVAALRLPHYRGSIQASEWLLPLPYLVYRGTVLRADRDGARALLFERDRVEFDLSLSANAPTKSDDDEARRGMPDLAPTFEIGPKLNLRLAQGAGWKADFRLPLRAVVTLQSKPRSVGWSVEPVLNLDFEIGDWRVGAQGGPLWGDRRLHGYFYGVPAAYATETRGAYRAGAGWAGWQATAALSRRVGAVWSGFYVRADSLSGATFEASPLVRSRHGLAYGLAFSWVLATSAERVPGDD